MPSGRDNGDSDPAASWFTNRQRAVRFRTSEVAQFAGGLRRRLARGREFAVCIASDDALLRANRRFRNKAGSTDVLAFRDEGGSRLGDILISARRARLQAERLGHGVEEELKILLLHGVLHLLGYDHERDGGRMRRVETRWRQRLGLPAGLIERSRV
jgi:probable rRNA maturation factor